MTDPANQAPPTPRCALWPWLLVGMVILFVVGVRVRLLAMPLERDEGEYAYAGQLMLQGIPPYQLAYNMKLPGTYAAYAAIMAVFGQSTEGIHLGLIVVNAACIVLMFLLGRRLFDATAGIVAAATYGVVTLSPTVLGLAAHATHFVVLAMLGGLLCLLRALATGRRAWYFAGGLLFGIAFVMKQQGVFFGLFGGAWLVWNGLKSRPVDRRRFAGHTGWYALGCVLPFAVVCLWMWRAGVFGKFWFWTFVYAQTYVTATSLAEGAARLQAEFLRFAPPHWPLALLTAAGSVLLWWKRPARDHALLVTAFFVFSAAAVCPGLYFRRHYFLVLVPAFSLLVAVGASFPGRLPGLARLPAVTRRIPVVLAALALVFAVWQQGDTFFVRTPAEVVHDCYGVSPFSESVEIARYIREHTTKDARVLIFGSEPQIYFYSGRHSASGFIYMYDLLEDQPFAIEMQKRLIQEAEAARPEFFVLVGVPTSGVPGPASPRLITDWGARYCRSNYVMVGAIDLISPKETDYVWGGAAADYVFRSKYRILVFSRNPGM